MSAVISSSSVTRVPPSPALLGLQRPLGFRVALLTGLVAAIVVAAAVSVPPATAAAEPGLALLLRGMALIKAGIALVAVALTLWRFGQPVSSPAALGYLLGVWSMIGASVLIWQLCFIPAAAVIFHVGLFGILLLAWREGHFASRGVCSDLSIKRASRRPLHAFCPAGHVER